MTPNHILQKVEAALDMLIATGAQHEGLIPSILDRHTGQMPVVTPDPIPGQRQHDRSPRGCNPLHDVELLELMYQLGALSGRERYRRAGDRYLARFANHCTDTVSGLFPWGEHAYWNLDRDALGNSQAFANRTVSRGAYHDHLREAPIWVWDKIYAANPACVSRFGLGLKYHWKSGKLAHEYFRHAYLEMPEIPLPHEAGSRDFPRHGGFYILDWAFAYCRFRDANFEAQMRRMNDYWWWHHHPCGMLPQFSRHDAEEREDFLSMAQSLSYAATTLDAAEYLTAENTLPDLAKSLRERATIYATSCMEIPSHPEPDTFFHMFYRDNLQGAEHARMVAWGTTYSMQSNVASQMTVASLAAFMLRIHRHTDDPRLLSWCEAAAQFLLRTPLPKGQIIPAKDTGQALLLLLGLYEITGESHWLDSAGGVAALMMELYFDAPLPRLATHCDWYEAQQGTGLLLLALGRYALLAGG